MEKKILILPAPSTFAASRSSSGMAEKYSFIKNIIVTLPNNPGRINGHGVPVRCTSLNMRYDEVIMLQPGIIIVKIRKENTMFLPGKYSLEYAYALNEDKNTHTTVVGKA